MDKLLQEFHLNIKYHENAISHAKEKGMKLNTLNIFFQPEAWDILTEQIKNGNYHTPPSEIKYVDKLSGNRMSYKQAINRNMKEVRELFVLEAKHRVVWNMFYQILYNRFSYLIHPLCVSYKMGESTRTVARNLSKYLAEHRYYKGIKIDLSKYFDSVPIELIDKTFDELESIEPSAIWKPIRECYHDNRVVINGEMVERYGSLKQGNPIGCLLADLVLRDVDEEMSHYDICYYRYSDDIILVGKDYLKAYKKLEAMLTEKGIKINEKKKEYLSYKEFFTFLGYRFQNGNITVSKKTLNKICHKIKSETIFKCKKLKRPLTDTEIKKAIDNIQYYLFIGCKEHPGGMATYLFGACNIRHDFNEIDEFTKDCIRAAKTNKCKMYGLGCWHTRIGVIHCYGQNNVGMNRTKYEDLPRELGWYSLNHMYNKYLQSKDVYKMEIRKIQNGYVVETD